ncbi:MAG: ATP-binding protein [Deltaproteobacteria bacterium]|nr:ATP-binding protein [Deltaproteobacteria bacterium]
MARADLLLDLVRAGAKGDHPLFRKSLEALVAEERAKQHHVLADRLAAHLNVGVPGNSHAPTSPVGRNGPSTDSFHQISPERRLGDLVLPPNVTRAAAELVEEFQRADLLRAHNLEPRHRVLLTGPPGNGKTSLAEVFATELAVPLFAVRYESVIASYLGETAVRLSRLFDEVRTRRCVLFFDEFDVVGKERGDIHETGEIKRVVSSLLLQIDDLPSHVVVVTATNHPELLDRAVWRRFQVRLNLPAPTSALAEEWFCRFEKRLGEGLGHKPAALAKVLKGLSFSELEQFALDVQRQYVLTLPEGDLHAIVAERINQWRNQPSATSLSKAPSEGRDA